MRRRLLLADNSITIQRLVSLTFADEAIDVIATGDGESAMKKAHELRPDIILVDVSLPGKNGYQICESIKSDPQLNSIPVILLAGTFEPLDETEARRVKADGHLVKPFESSVLINLVKDLIGLTPAEETKGGGRGVRGESEVSRETPVASDVEESSLKATFARQAAGPKHDLPQTAFEPQPLGGLLELEFDFSNAFNDSTRGSFIDAPILDIYNDTALQILRGEIRPPSPEQKAPQVETAGPVPGKMRVEEPIESAGPVEEVFDTDAIELELTSAPVKEPESMAASTSPLTESTPSPVSEEIEEIIDLIVRRVLEKMSDAVIREIAWEVVPELSEKIIKDQLNKEKKKS